MREQDEQEMPGHAGWTEVSELSWHRCALKALQGPRAEDECVAARVWVRGHTWIRHAGRGQWEIRRL